MSTSKMMNAARAVARKSVKDFGKDYSRIFRVARESLKANGMQESILDAMAEHVMRDMIQL